MCFTVECKCNNATKQEVRCGRSPMGTPFGTNCQIQVIINECITCYKLRVYPSGTCQICIATVCSLCTKPIENKHCSNRWDGRHPQVPVQRKRCDSCAPIHPANQH